MVRGKDRFKDRWSFTKEEEDTTTKVEDITEEEDDRQLIKSIGEIEKNIHRTSTYFASDFFRLNPVVTRTSIFLTTLCVYCSMERLYIPIISNGSIPRNKLHRSECR